MLASSLLALVALAILEGVGVASRIARENAQLLEADAIAWDAVWKKFNESYDTLERGYARSYKTSDNTTVYEFKPEELSREAAPGLYVSETGTGDKPVLTVSVEPFRVAQDSGYIEMKAISADIEWGPSGNRHLLSKTNPVFVYRSSLGRTVP